MKYLSGQHFPLGATVDENGTNFALYTENAEKVELCLFNSSEDSSEYCRIELTEKTNFVWHIYIPEVKAGQLYGYRVHGPYDPQKGHRFNHHKLLLDPYAKAITNNLKWDDALWGFDRNGNSREPNTSDSGAYMPKCIVIDNYFDWEEDHQLRHAYHKTIIYEAHVKGLTVLHPDVPEEIRGSYAGIAHPAITEHLKSLGITAIELMPVHYFLDDPELLKKGLTNYWGYETIGFFAPHTSYCSSNDPCDAVKEFKQMVKTLHKEGIEVIIDVVYNHTGEDDENGPTVCFRGIDNKIYYRHPEDDLSKYKDYTGTGNTLNTSNPFILQMIMDSLRYWILEMHVDGFRFDLAAALARELHEVDKLSAFFDIIHQDPVISKVKLIAEPWDLGEDGLQVGEFPAGWAEWNGQYRDRMKKFWRGDTCELADFADKFTGSPDLYKNDYRTPAASINYITSHDGFTLRDQVSYDHKHNEKNLEDNKDGTDDNYSSNQGAEGDTSDAAIISLRKKQQRNMLATIFLSQGVPMIRSGDEIGNTQYGNNNAYCQDNEISWIKWNETDNDLLSFIKTVIHLRKEHPSFSRKGWFQGRDIYGSEIEDIKWFGPDGERMTEEQWNTAHAKALGIFLDGDDLRFKNDQGEEIKDDHFYILFNADSNSIGFKLPEVSNVQKWKIALSTQEEDTDEKTWNKNDIIEIEGKCVVVLQNSTNQ